MTNHKLSEKQIREYLDFVDLNLDFNTSLKTMSGGERQRLAIVCGIVKDAKLFIFDEPTSYLDNENKKKIISIIQNLAYKKGKMVVIASHDDVFRDISDQIYQIKNKTLQHVKSSTFKNDIKDLKHSPMNLKALYQYSIDKNKVYCFIVGIILGIVLMGFVISLIYGSLFSKSNQDSLLSSIHHIGTIVRNDEKLMNVTEQTKLKLSLHDFQVFPYRTIETTLISNDVKLNHITIKPYYNQMINNADILQKNHQLNSTSVYATYEIFHYLNKHIFDQLSNESGIELKIDAVLRPSYDYEQAIYVPFDIIYQYYQNQNIDLMNTQINSLSILFESLDDYQQVSQTIQKPYQLITNPDISSQVQLNKLFGSEYLTIAWGITLIIIFVYNTYKIIEDKRNIALLESLGVGFPQLIKMRILEQIMMLLSMGVVALVLSIIITFILNIEIMKSLIMICILIIAHIIIMSLIDLIIFIAFIKKYSVALLLKSEL